VAAGPYARAAAGSRVVVRAATVALALTLLGAAPRPEVGVVVISGTLQTVPAYASAGANSYVAEFPKPLVVHIVGKHVNSHRVRYTCGTPHCALGVPNEPLQGTRVDAQTYEVQADNRQAALKITLTNDLPGPAIVWAAPVGDHNERIERSAFLLTLR
jgi:hypothetical protein